MWCGLIKIKKPDEDLNEDLVELFLFYYHVYDFYKSFSISIPNNDGSGGTLESISDLSKVSVENKYLKYKNKYLKLKKYNL